MQAHLVEKTEWDVNFVTQSVFRLLRLIEQLDDPPYISLSLIVVPCPTP